MWVLRNSLSNTSFSEPYLGAITHHNCLCRRLPVQYLDNNDLEHSFSEDKDT